MRPCDLSLLAFVAMSAASVAFAFNGERYTVEPITVQIGQVPAVTQRETPVPVTVTVSNSADQPVEVTLRTGMTDGWRTQEPAEFPLTVPAQGEAEREVHVICAADAYSALYPLHVTAVFEKEGRETECHAVQVIETKLPPAETGGGELETLKLLDGGALNLVSAKSWQVRWQYFDGAWIEQPPNWQGSVEGCRASMHRGNSIVRGGVTYRTINMHPPWTGGKGTVMSVFKAALPETPARLRFFTSIRDHTETEPPSDGVLFRVWADDGTGPRQLFERFSDAKVWEAGEADLSAYAGKTIELALESHPGPDQDTTCDSSYWGEPIIISGERPAPPTAEKRATRVSQLIDFGRAILRGQEPTALVHLFRAGEGEDEFACLISPRQHGLLDAEIAFVYGDRALVIEGFRLSVNDQPLGTPESSLVMRSFEPIAGDPGKFVHRFEGPDFNCEVTVAIRLEGEAVRFDFECNERITHLSVGPFSETARRCYVGPGNVIEEPEHLWIGGGGHGLATSYYGCDFEGGVSLIQATTVPPDYAEASPGERAYPLVTHLDGSVLLVPSRKSSFDAALKLQRIWQPQPAGGVAKVAGKFVFDVWGGRYADIATDMERAARYGMTDSMLLVHNWQRWGYDYRLPDIWPPNPMMGSLEDMKRIGEVCGEQGILWGPHDNYIDYYPDAEEFSYDHVYFTPGGEPRKAWYNEGRQAQSYKFRPDHIMPFVQRNLRLIKPNLGPTAYFIDVFTSAPVIDYWDREGSFHSKLETQRCWGEAFAWIRDFLGDNAPQISEAGHDHLVGYLDGAQCQMLRITPEGVRHTWRVKCADWERVPWFNAVWHDKFILHGVGYSSRYQGGQPFLTHGVYSDDYISSEVLCGNPGMVAAGFRREWVAKYWLIQPLMRSLALATMTGHEFAEGGLHRQTVTWSNGATVHVNRGEDPWTVAGRTLPQYGFHAESGDVASAIEMIDGIRVAHSRAPDYLFVDARSLDPDTRFPVTVKVAELEYLGERSFRIAYEWNAERPTDKEYRAFVHFCSDRSEKSDRIAFQGDHAPDPPTTAWQGTVRTETTVTVPEKWGAGAYDIRVGLYVPGGTRLRLRGPSDEGSRVKLGQVTVEGEGENITDIRLQLVEYEPDEVPDFNREGKVVSFGPVSTNGAFRLVLREGAMELTPLPEQPPAQVSIDLAKAFEGRAPQRISRVITLDADGKATGHVDSEQIGSFLGFVTDGKAFAYRLEP